MLMKDGDLYPENVTLQEIMNNLSFVTVMAIPGTSDQVRYTFSHPTFLEYFAALHLTTLPPNEQLAYISRYTYRYRYKMSKVQQFYFGLTSNIHQHNTSAVSYSLKQVFTGIGPRSICEYLKSHQVYDVMYEVGWTGRASRELLQSMKLLKTSVVCVHCMPYRHELSHLPYPDQFPCTTSNTTYTLDEHDSSIVIDVNIGFTIELDNKNSSVSEQDIQNIVMCMSGGIFNDIGNCRNFTSSIVTSLIGYWIDDFHKLSDLRNFFPNLKSLIIHFDDVDIKPRSETQFHNWSNLEQVEIEVIVPKMMYGVLKLFANVRKINLNVRHRYDFRDHHLKYLNI